MARAGRTAVSIQGGRRYPHAAVCDERVGQKIVSNVIVAFAEREIGG